MNTNSIPTTLNDLLVKLKIISMVERGKKINMSSMSFVDSTSWVGAFQRSLSGEGRRNILLFLQNLIAQSIEAIKEYYDTEFCRIIVNHLAECKIGIINLMTTYQNDPHIIAQLKICVENIDLQLDKNKKLLDGH